MVIKLVQTDSIDPNKITLSVGEHSFGRGKLLGCNDKRISRNHGQLKAYNDHIEIKALHHNPCFYIKNGTNDKQVLRKDSVISLFNGDRFGLLPDALWYEVLHCTLLNKPPEKNETEDTNTEEYSTEPNTKGNENSNLDETINDNASAESPSLISPINENSSDNTNKAIAPQNQDSNTDSESRNETQKPNHNEQENTEAAKITSESGNETQKSNHNEQENTEAAKITSESGNETQKSNHNEEENTEAAKITSESGNETQKLNHNEQENTEAAKITSESGKETQKSNHKEQENTEAAKITVKRSHSTDQVEDSKKIKTDAEVKTEPAEVKTESQDVTAGPSNDQPAANNSAAVNDNAPSAAHPNRRLRERCMYGGNCYRRNPAHFTQFSHPRDPDWGDGARAPCPGGIGCMRSDPRHHRDHYHPDGHVPPPPRGMRRFERHGNLFYIDAAAQVNFYDDHFAVVDSEGSVDHDYEF